MSDQESREASYLDEFQDFDPATMPPIPEGWQDISWHNDACPSFLVDTGVTGGLTVFVDYADDVDREIREGTRFCVLASIGMDGENDITILETDEWSDVLRLVEAVNSDEVLVNVILWRQRIALLAQVARIDTILPRVPDQSLAEAGY